MPSKNLPNRILRAIDSALHITGINRSLKATLAEICRFLPQTDPFATVFAYKSKIAQRIDASERTVYRHLTLLEQAGLIENLPQERKSRNGRFAVARIRLTRRAAELLGFVEPSNEVFHSAPSDKMAAGHTVSVPTIPKNQPPRGSDPTLPADLGWLAGNGLSRWGIFKLMGMARQHHKLLSDLIAARHEKLRTLKGGRLYCYLAKLIVGNTDFADAAAKANAERRARDDRAAAKQRQQSFIERFAGCRFVTRAADVLLILNRGGHIEQFAPGGRMLGVAPVGELPAFMTAVAAGKLVLATSDVERGFAMPF